MNKQTLTHTEHEKLLESHGDQYRQPGTIQAAFIRQHLKSTSIPTELFHLSCMYLETTSEISYKPFS